MKVPKPLPKAIERRLRAVDYIRLLWATEHACVVRANVEVEERQVAFTSFAEGARDG